MQNVGNDNPYFQTDNLKKEFLTRGRHVQALRSVSFKVEQGEQIAIIGPSGSGKTTLIRILSLAIPATSGSLLIHGQSVQSLHESALRKLRRDIGVIYQQHNLVKRLSTLQNVISGQLGRWSLPHTIRALYRLSKPETQSGLNALEKVDLVEKALERTSTLSGGQQQRVAIARVLMQSPRAILADEPVSSLDPTLADEIIRLLISISRSMDTTLISSLHSIELALKYFSRVIGIREGAVSFDLPASRIRRENLNALYERSNGR